MSVNVECVLESRDELGECPLWDESEQALWWVDILAPSLHRLGSSLKSYKLPEAMGSFAFRKKGGFLAAMKSGFYLLDAESLSREPFCAPEARSENRFNDGRCDRAGRFWAGTMNERMCEPTGALYRLSPSGKCSHYRGGITVPNCLAWSPDGRTMYFADSPTRSILAFDYDPHSGEPSNERLFATTQAGFPDGSCVDAEGCLWNAEYHGWRVVRYTPQGKIDRVVQLPVENPTCCCFGGKDLDTLYITSARQHLKPQDLGKQPLAGGLFAVRPGVCGLAESRFAG